MKLLFVLVGLFAKVCLEDLTHPLTYHKLQGKMN